MSSELLWFISGSNNINDLKAIYQHNKIWDANYEDYLKRFALDTNDGDMGRVYGTQWRSWQTPDGKQVDQLNDAIDLIRNNPDSRRIIVNAWNPGEAASDQVALPPCHAFFQFYIADDKLSLQMYQRSADMFLGVPLNIASYSLLLHMVAKITDLEPFEFIHTLGDAHIYLDAVDQVKEQITREPYPLPRLDISDRGQASIDDFVMEDFSLTDYQSHESIKAKMAV
jgi:thymidylate synthase